MHQPLPQSRGCSTGLGSRTRPAGSSPGLSSAGGGCEQPPMSPGGAGHTCPELWAPHGNVPTATASKKQPTRGPKKQEDRSRRLCPPNCEAQGPSHSHQGSLRLPGSSKAAPSLLTLVAQSPGHRHIRTDEKNLRWVRLGIRW